MSFFKNKKANIIIIGAISTAIIIPFSLMLTSCSKQQKQEYWTKNGGASSFLKTSKDEIIHLNGGRASFCISALEGEYFDAAVASINEANKFSALKISYSFYDSNFVFNIDQRGEGGGHDYAVTNSKYNDSTGVILSSTVSYNSDMMKYCNLNEKTHVAIHEMGHVLGLADVYDKNVIKEKATIMYYQADAGDTFTSFREWDIQNIIFCYGGEYH